MKVNQFDANDPPTAANPLPRFGNAPGMTFYPFLMMDVPADNTLSDPYSDNAAEHKPYRS